MFYRGRACNYVFASLVTNECSGASLAMTERVGIAWKNYKTGDYIIASTIWNNERICDLVPVLPITDHVSVSVDSTGTIRDVSCCLIPVVLNGHFICIVISNDNSVVCLCVRENVWVWCIIM